MKDLLIEVQKITAGFFLALLLNSLVQLWRDRRTYQSMLCVIQAEAESNRTILAESFRKFIRDGIVLREFSLEVVSQYLKDPLFVRQAGTANLESLQRYLRTLRLANIYRQKAEGILLAEKESDWLEGIREAWEENLDRCELCIARVPQRRGLVSISED